MKKNNITRRLSCLLIATAASQSVLATVTANNDTATTRQGTPVDIDELANDSTDLVDTGIFVCSYDTATANGGSVVADPDTGVFTYTPASGFSGEDTFTYSASDSTCYGGVATATVTVNVVDGTPVQANNDTVTAASGTPLTIAVLANDTYPSQTPITVASDLAVSPAGAGSISVNANNQIVFTSTADYIGTATFTYSISNALADTSSAAVTVDVKAAPSVTLQANNDAANVPVNPGSAGATRINVLANDTYDPTLVTLTPPSSVTPAEAGSVAYDEQTREILFTPTAHYRGTATFTYAISDGVNQSSATVTAAIGTATIGLNALLNDTERRAAQVLDSACATATGALENSCAVLQGLSPQDQQKAIEQILPNQVPAQLQGALLQMDQQLSLLRHRLDVLRGGAHGIDVSGLNIRLQDNSMALGQALQSEIDDSGSAGDAKAFADTPWGLFLSGRINHGEIDTRGAQKGYDYRNDVLTAGIDYRRSDKFVLGSALGYSATRNDLSSDSGSLDLTSWMLSFYGNYYPLDNWYVDWVAGYSDNAYKGKRHLQFGSIDEQARFDSDGRQYSLSLTTGYDWSLQAWQLGSYVRADYIHALVDAYTESDSAGLALKVGEQQERSLETALGGSVSYAWSYSRGVLIPGIDLEYVHQWQRDQRFVSVALAEAPDSGTFGIDTSPLDKNYFNLGLILTSVYTGGKSAFIRWETVLERQNVRANNIEAGFRMEF